MKYEITIRNTENEEDNKTMECEEFLVITMTPDEGGVHSQVYINSSIEHMSMAIGDNGNTCAAARYAVARRDADRDMKEAKMQERSRELLKAMVESDATYGLL